MCGTSVDKVESKWNGMDDAWTFSYGMNFKTSSPRWFEVAETQVDGIGANRQMQ